MQLLTVQLTCELSLTDGEHVQGRGERRRLMRTMEENEECSTEKKWKHHVIAVIRAATMPSCVFATSDGCLYKLLFMLQWTDLISNKMDRWTGQRGKRNR